MSTKVKRKVTVENSKESTDHPRRPSVFERLGPGAVTVAAQSQNRTSRVEQNEKCRNWLRDGTCCYGNTCRYQHDPFPNSSRRSKSEKEIDEKDLRHKMRNKRDEAKESRTGSISPKRKESKRSRSRSRKGEHESKIKSTVVVTRPRSPAAPQTESSEKEKKKPEGSWEDDSDDWQMDPTQLDYKEELTLERKRQQLQRELELELQKERLLNENVSFSDSSSSSSSSDSGSRSSSSDSTSSSSDEDSDESSSSSSSSSSSASQAPVKKKYKKPQNKKEPVHKGRGESGSRKKPLDDYDQIKSSRAAKSGWRPRSPASPDVPVKKGRDRKNVSPPTFSPKRRSGHDSNLKAPPPQSGRKGPRTPSPPPVGRKQRQWGQSSSADSRSADVRRNRGKRHKKKKDNAKNDRNRMDYAPTPPPLSSPNRTALQPHLGKKTHSRDDSGLRNRNRGRDQSPLLLSRIAGQSNSPSMRHSGHYSEPDRFSDKQNQPKSINRKSDDINQSRVRRVNSKERPGKHPRLSSPNKDPRRSVSPAHDKYETDSLSRRVYSSPLPPLDKDDKGRRHSISPNRRNKENKDRRKVQNDSDKRRDNRDISPRPHDNRRDNQYRNNEVHRKDDSREVKKGRDDKMKDRGQKDRNLDHDSWSDEPKKNIMRGNDSRRPAEPPLVQSARGGDRSRDRERDRKKGKEREPLMRTVEEIERDRQRLSPTVSRVPPDIHPHHALRDDVPRGRLYEPEIPPDDRDYAYGYVPHREPVYLDEHPLPPEYEPDLRGPPLYPPPDPVDYVPPGYPETRYRRDPTLKAVAPVPHIERIPAYGPRDISPLDPRDPVGLPVREEDYLADLPIDDRRAYDERWGRARPVRDEWDPYAPLPPNVLPPHVVASLDEDRYGMPRRRRASPEWLLRRNEERDIPIREPRSRSPQMRRGEDVCPPNRGSWGDHPDRHSNRNNDSRQDIQQKPNSNQDDRKNRNNRRDRRDRNKRNDEPVNETKPTIQKEKILGKRPHSSSPGRKDAKKRKEDTSAVDSPSADKAPAPKKPREEPQKETKSSSSNRKTKSGSASPKLESSSKVEKEKEKPETSEKSVSKTSSKHDGDEKRKPATGGKTAGDDDFSDWSDGDDDLLNRDDFVESESKDADRVRSKTDENKKERSTKSGDSTNVKESDRKHKKENSKDSRSRTGESKSESRSRAGGKESDLKRLLTYCTMSSSRPAERNPAKLNDKASNDTSSTKTPSGQPQSAKESSSSEPVATKNDVVETEEFATTENDEYDPISDEEFEALIEEPDDSLMKTDVNEEIKIVDALDINWSTLMSEPKPDVAPSKARNRFKAAHVLSRIGFSQSLAGSALSEKIIQFCQKQLEEEKEEEEKDQDASSAETRVEDKKFVMEHPIASFHVSLAQKKKERQELFSRIGSSRRALCARQDLHIRKLLCHPAMSLITSSSSGVQQCSNTDMDQCRQSPELKKLECSTPIVNAAC